MNIYEDVTKKLTCIPEYERNLILAEIISKTPIGMQWLEKIRKYVSLAGRNIERASKKNFSNSRLIHLDWFVKCLEAGLLGNPHDQALMNAMLYLEKYLTTTQKIFIEEKCLGLEAFLLQTEPKNLGAENLGPVFTGVTKNLSLITDYKGIVILSPSPFSLYTLVVYQLLSMLGIRISAVLIRKFSVTRFKQEFSRDGYRLLRKIWRKLILRSDENPIASKVSLKIVAQDFNLQFSDIRKIAHADGVTVIEIDDFTKKNAKLESLDTNIGIFTGGGMVGDALLSMFPNGVINTHMGSLPKFKGMDVVEAPILEGYFNDITLTSHKMVTQLDAGAVLQKFQLSSRNYKTLGALRNELSAVMPLLAVDTTLGYLSGRLQEIVQLNSGRQYYFIHPRLQKILKTVIDKRFLNDRDSHPKNVFQNFCLSLKENCSVN